jgi:hypothetical protein
MDELSLISSSGGSDLMTAGTYKLITSDVATITLTSATSAGTATITINGLAKVATFATDLKTTCQNFVVANYDAYAALGVILTAPSDTDTIVCTMTAKLPQKVTASIANLTTDLTGTVAKTRSGPSQVVVFTLTSATSHAGATCLITVNGLSKRALFDTSIEITSTAFVAANAAAYLAVGLVLTGTTTIIFTAQADIDITLPSIQTLHSDLTGTFVVTNTKLPHPIAAFSVHEDAVITSLKHLVTLQPNIINANESTTAVMPVNGVATSAYKHLFGATLNTGAPVFIFKYPVAEIVLASGELVVYYVK